MSFHDKIRLKSENLKMELAIPQDRVDVYLAFSERIVYHMCTQSYAKLNFEYNHNF